jgi:hypothetical protein
MSKEDANTTFTIFTFSTPVTLEDMFLQMKRSEHAIVSSINSLILVIAIASLCIIGGVGAMLVMLGEMK